MRDDQNE